MKHVKYFFTRKYLLLLLPVVVYMVISGYMIATDGKGYFDDGQAVSHFVPETQEYSSMEELGALLENTRNKLRWTDENDDNYELLRIRLAWYEYLYENEIGYDEIASFNGARKFSKFSIFNNFSEPVFLFVFIASVFIGALLLTWDFQTDTAKLVYSSGESKLKVLFLRYGISLAALTVATIVIMIIYAIVANGLDGVSEIGLMSEYKIYSFSFGEYATISTLSTLLNLWLVYTTVYFASAAFHNSVIPLCGAILGFILIFVIRTTGGQADNSMFGVFINSTLFGILKGVYTGGDNPPVSLFLLYIINVSVALATAVAGTAVFIKRDVL